MLCNKCNETNTELFYPYSPTLCKTCYTMINRENRIKKKGAMKVKVRAIFKKWCETGIFDAKL